MPISRVDIKDFLVFKEELHVSFCPGVNVLIGANGTGKTTLLKAMYMACTVAKKRYKTALRESESAVSEPRQSDDWHKMHEVISVTPYFPYFEYAQGVMTSMRICIETSSDQNEPAQVRYQRDISTPDAKLTVYGFDPVGEVVYIPYTDVLSHSKGFLPLYYERDMPFDETYADVLSKAQLPVTRRVTPIASAVIDILKSVIGGEVICENDVFFVKKEDNRLVPFTLEASGYRKLGLLWKLLRNGLLESGSMLFWDEPENSLNPELIPVLVDILLKLSQNGVQVFIATHSELLSSYFAVNRLNANDVLFTSLYKDEEHICTNASNRFDLLEPNSLADEPVKLYKKELEKGLGGNG